MKCPAAFARWLVRCRVCGINDSSGSVAVELAFVVPIVALIAIGIADFGTLATRTDALAGATRIGAEYAKNSTTCQAGIQILATPQVNSPCTTGIQNAVTNSVTFNPAPTFPASFPLTCECDDGTSIACGNNSCAAAGRPAPNRVFIRVSASQSFTPVISWPGAPSTLNSATEIRLQ
jgi:hypothetical protein